MSSIPEGLSTGLTENRPKRRQVARPVKQVAQAPDCVFNWWIQSATEFGLRVADDEELIFATMSPFESGEVARRLSRRLGIPWVADLRDPWALDEMQVYPSLLHRRLEMRPHGARVSDFLAHHNEYARSD